MKTMKALVKKRAEPGLWLDEVPVPRIGINDVLIEVLRTGICGTDLHIYHWDAWAQRTIPVPLVVGHEFVGRIVEVGSNVMDFRPGEIVSGEGHVVCGHCRNCLAGRRHLCKDTQGVGVTRPGAFAEYLALPMSNVRPRPVDQRDAQALFDLFGNAVHTALSIEVPAKTCWSPAPVPSASWLRCRSSCRRPARRRHRCQPCRLDSHGGWATLALTSTQSVADAQREPGMKEGFDVGFDVRNAPLFAACWPICATAAKSMLGIWNKKCRWTGLPSSSTC